MAKTRRFRKNKRKSKRVRRGGAAPVSILTRGQLLNIVNSLELSNANYLSLPKNTLITLISAIIGITFIGTDLTKERKEFVMEQVLLYLNYKKNGQEKRDIIHIMNYIKHKNPLFINPFQKITVDEDFKKYIETDIINKNIIPDFNHLYSDLLIKETLIYYRKKTMELIMISNKQQQKEAMNQPYI